MPAQPGPIRIRMVPDAAPHDPSRQGVPCLMRYPGIGARLQGPAVDEQAISFAGVGTLLLTSLALMGSPGPSTVSVTAVGAAFGLRRSLAYVLGLILGT